MNARFTRVMDHESNATGYVRVETNVSCLLTRFRLRSVLSLVRFYIWFRLIRQHSRDVNGLLVSAFLVEDLRTCYTFSIWRDPGAIIDFNTRILTHVDAANAAFGGLEFDSDGPQLWSAQFRLSAVSPNNLRWKGLDLGSVRAWMMSSSEKTPMRDSVPATEVRDA